MIQCLTEDQGRAIIYMVVVVTVIEYIVDIVDIVAWIFRRDRRQP